jgi:hypothetical protein
MRRALSVITLSALLVLGARGAELTRASSPSLADVTGLLDQLKSADARQAAQAEADLVRLGPAALRLLPADIEKLPEAQRKRLEAVIAALKAITPSAFTLRDESIALESALQLLQKQTGIQISDHRTEKTNPRLKLDLEKVTFWQGLDAIAREARVVVSLYQGNGKIALVDGVYRPYPVSYSGLFRVAAKRITVAKDLASGDRFCTVNLELAWEPRLQPFFVDQGASKVSFTGPENRREAIDQEGTGFITAYGRSALDFAVRFPAPERKVVRLDSFAGRLDVVTPCKMLTFSFDDLSKVEDGKSPIKLVQEGVTARVTRLSPDDDPWDVEIKLDNPPGGARFESHQSWLVNNEAFLENKKSGAKVTPRGIGFQRGSHPHGEILYYFSNPKNRLGKPSDWRLVCRTPGRIVTLAVRFELRDLPLP